MIAKLPPFETPPQKPESAAGEQGRHDHEHGFAPHFLPHWIQDHWSVLTVTIAGVALAVGFFGEQFLGLPPSVALGFYLSAYLAGGYDVAREAIPALFRRKLDIDILMLAAAAGAALPGEWAEGALERAGE